MEEAIKYARGMSDKYFSQTGYVAKILIIVPITSAFVNNYMLGYFMLLQIRLPEKCFEV
jgi:hypothetical protein